MNLADMARSFINCFIMLQVPQKFRYPFFTEMHWYLLVKYVAAILKENHWKVPLEEPENIQTHSGYTHLTVRVSLKCVFEFVDSNMCE